MKKNITDSNIIIFVIVISLLFCSCITVGPDYHLPEVSLPSEWSASISGGLRNENTSSETLSQWWTLLNDSDLSNLIEKARSNNLDLKQAEARVREARARWGIAEGAFYPTLEVNASGNRSHSSEDAGSGNTSDFFTNSFDAKWELDLFGKNRRALESADATLEAAENDLSDVLVTLFAEVALNYVDVRLYQKQLSILDTNITTLIETYKITKWRRDAGLTSQLDVEQAKLNLELTRSKVPILQTSLEKAKHALSILLGQEPGALKTLLEKSAPIPVPPAEVAIGIPADLLRRRPDVRRAERKLAAQTAQVGVATAALYPNFSLLGGIGLDSLIFGNLYSAKAYVAHFGANTAWTLFDGGQIRQNIKVENAIQEQALAFYESSVIAALGDVENALIAYANEKFRNAALVAAVNAGEGALDLALKQYSSGLVDFQAVLDSQRSLLSAQEQLAASDGEITSNTIRLYKALGGGWDPIVSVDSTQIIEGSGAKL